MRKSIFRIERVGDDGDVLGWEWVEVLAIEPWAMGWPGREYGEWAQAEVLVRYVCRTPDGLVQIASKDLWHAIEAGSYTESSSVI